MHRALSRRPRKARVDDGLSVAGNIPLLSKVAYLVAGLALGLLIARLLAPGITQVNLAELPPPPRIERPCSPSPGKTAVLVIHGQSNSANYGNTRHVAREAVDNFDPATGKCFAAADPLLGADGAGGSFATRLGDILIQSGRYDRVIVAAVGVEGASLSVLNNEQVGRIDNVLARLKSAGLTPTHILFQQGEKDAVLTTTKAQYVSLLHRLVRRIRDAGFDAPFYLSQSTKCDVAEPKNVEEVRAGQRAAIDATLNIRPGPDTDVIANDGRNPFDGCHMNVIGTLANAALWASFVR